MKNKITAGIALLLVFSAVAVDAASVSGEIAALRAAIASNSVDRTVRCRYYTAWYRDLCTEDERSAILDRNVAARRRWMEIANRKDVARLRAELGKVLAIGGRWEEAEKELSAAITGGLDSASLVDARWALAECLWRRKDQEGAKKLVAEIAAMEFPSEKPPFAWRKAKFLHRAWTDPDGDIDVFRLPHSVDCKPFPTPQEAKYGEKKVSLARVELKFKTNGTGGTDGTSPASRISPVSPDDPIIRLLKKKLARFGTKFEKGGTPIEIEISPDALVDKPQGYSLDVANGKVSIKAKSRLGLTYGVVSLMQCVDREKLAVAECEIRDWPKCENRGVINYWDGDHVEYSLFAKMSFVTMRMGGRAMWDILFSPLERERCRLTARRYIDFGISCYWSERWLTVDPMLPFTSPRVRAMHLAWMRYAASVGANVSFELDDSRFPLPAADVAAGKTATSMDAKYVTGLYREVKAEHPAFRMSFCQPFYWGPDGRLDKNLYNEPREQYLKSMAEFLDPEIDMPWTGPRVKTAGITPEKFRWFADRVGHRAITIAHNSDCVGRHGHTSFGVDVPNFKDSHCPDVFDLTSRFCQNTSRYCEACRAYPAMDWCWNPIAHDAATATRRMMDLLEGPGVFDVLTEAMPSLAYFDKYPSGRPHSEVFTEDLAALDSRIATAETAWSNALKIAKNGGKFFWDFNAAGIKWAKQIAEARRNPPKWLVEKRDADLANTKFAIDEVGYDGSKGDLFFPSVLMPGGFYNPQMNDWSKKGPRGIKYVGPGKEVELTFSCANFPPEQPPKLVVVAMAYRLGEAPEMEVEANGRVVWRGKAFRAHYFKPKEVELPVEALQRTNNRIVIRNATPDDGKGCTILVHYVVIRK